MSHYVYLIMPLNPDSRDTCAAPFCGERATEAIIRGKGEKPSIEWHVCRVHLQDLLVREEPRP